MSKLSTFQSEREVEYEIVSPLLANDRTAMLKTALRLLDFCKGNLGEERSEFLEGVSHA